MALTAKEESFCQLIATYGEKEKVKAYTEAGYSTNMSANAIGVAAARVFNKSKIMLRIKELRSIVTDKAEKSFKYTVEWRLKKLNDIVDAGLSTYEDQQGNKRREALSASKGAIDTMNSMLGVDKENEEGESMQLVFNVSAPIRDVKVTRGE